MKTHKIYYNDEINLTITLPMNHPGLENGINLLDVERIKDDSRTTKTYLVKMSFSKQELKRLIELIEQ